MLKRFFSVLIASVFLLCTVASLPVHAESSVVNYDYDKIYNGSNISNNNYRIHSYVIDSYLYSDGETLIRFQPDYNGDVYVVKYYDLDYNCLKTAEIPFELPIFGMFYADDNNYFILSGQINYDESDDVEVFRVTKYDKDWNRLGSDGLFGANTYIPFSGGSARADEASGYLMIRTAHEMYRSTDGYHHQACVTMQYDIANNKIVDSYYDVMNYRLGYVSHSFNQFIKLDGNSMVTVDHGDAYPRSVALLEYNNDISKGSFVPDYFYSPCTLTDLLTFPGNIGANFTGASVGGFEITGTSYVAAVNSINLDDYDNSYTWNIYVLAKDKNSSDVRQNQITFYAEGDTSAYTPQLVKLSNSSLMLLWYADDEVYYTKLDSYGNRVGEIFSLSGQLSDCQPIVHNGKVIWYTWDGDTSVFYEISASDLSDISVKTVTSTTEPVRYMLGDVDASGEVDTVDAVFVQRHATLLPDMESFVSAAADIDGDGDITIVDATYIQRHCTLVKVPYRIGEYFTLSK